MIRKTFERTKQWLISKLAIRRNFRVPQLGDPQRFSIDQLPPFTLREADLMLRDPHVVFGLLVRNGALQAAEVEVTGDPQQVAFVESQWNRIWQHFGGKLLRAKRYGYMPFEVTFAQQSTGDFQGMIMVDTLHDFHPSQARLVEKDGKPVAVEFRTDAHQPIVLPMPAAMWITFDQQFGNPYGQSINQQSYTAWHEKWMRNGAKEVLRLRMMKDGYSGDVFWVPDELVTLPDGSKIHYVEMVRRAQQSRMAGSSMTLIRKYDSQGRETSGYTPPHDNGKPLGILEWNDRVDWDIWKGQGVYREVFEAAKSGSGFSGRSIPLLMFLGSVSEEFKEIVHCVDRDLLRPLTHLNFGTQPDYEIAARPLMQTYAEEMNGSPMGGSSIGSQGS